MNLRHTVLRLSRTDFLQGSTTVVPLMQSLHRKQLTQQMETSGTVSLILLLPNE